MRNPLLATFDNQPSLVAHEMQGLFESSLNQASLALSRIEAANDKPVMADDFWFSPDDWRSSYRPYAVRDGVLLIPVKGVLLHDFGYQIGSWATGYAYLTKALERGLGDPDVKGIAWIHDTPGGHVAGNFDLVDKIYAARGQKPMRAYASESSYSAGYSIASAADSITVSRTGGVGSIGVVTVHLDVSKAMDAAGYKITFIHAGKHKVDGNPYEALPADVKERIQARIDELMSVFVSTVARNRGMDEQVIRDFEALTFTANQAVSNGLADAIGSLDDAIAVFAADLGGQSGDDMAGRSNRASRAFALRDGRPAGEQAAPVSSDRVRHTLTLAGIRSAANARASAPAASVKTGPGRAERAFTLAGIAGTPKAPVAPGKTNASRADKAFALRGQVAKPQNPAREGE